MTTLLAWFEAARWRLSLSHLLEMWLVWVPVCLATQSTVIAGWAVVVWYYSRKKLENENAAGHAQNPAATWSVGWFPWQWSKYQMLDVLFPAIPSIIIPWFVK